MYTQKTTNREMNFYRCSLTSGNYEMMIDINRAIELLKEKRKCFVSEADFQLELAWILKDLYPDASVRCEYVPDFDTSMHMDILVVKDGKWIPIELKYKTKGAILDVNQERYVLKNQAAKDIGCYLFLKDVQRIENIKENIEDRFSEGYSILLTNELSYCRPPRKKGCVYEDFSLHEGNIITGELDWADGTSEGTKANCSEIITLKGKYECHWSEYSKINDTAAGEFKYLLISI